MKRIRIILVVAVVLTVIPAISFCLTSIHSPNSSPLIGVWRLSEIAPLGDPTNRSPQPGIYIFTHHYFSHNAVSSSAPRALLPQGTLTDKDIADVAKGFLGSSGTYEVSGDQITVRVLVALNPNYMRPEYSRTYAFRFVGNDTLWLTETASGGVALRDPPMLKLTRLE